MPVKDYFSIKQSDNSYIKNFKNIFFFQSLSQNFRLNLLENTGIILNCIHYHKIKKQQPQFELYCKTL